MLNRSDDPSKEAIHERFGLEVFQLGQKILLINYFAFQLKLSINNIEINEVYSYGWENKQCWIDRLGWIYC